MHNGAFRTLDAAVRHHLDPEGSLRSYDVTAHLPPALQATFQRDPELLAELLATVDPVAPPEPLSDTEFADMLAFLAALTDPAVTNLPPPPERVPSGLPVADTP
jgi:cytochrome c peroxidase